MKTNELPANWTAKQIAAYEALKASMRDHYLAGCGCEHRAWCVPHGFAGTSWEHHRICADHGHVASLEEPIGGFAPPTGEAANDSLFLEDEAPRSFTSYAEEWIALTSPPEIAESNVRGFSVWLGLKEHRYGR